MPSDSKYWNSDNVDSDDSPVNSLSKYYLDPWDLENYAYIRDLHDGHPQDSLELSSEQSSYGEPVEANSSFYYAAVKQPKPYLLPPKQKYDSFVESEYGARYVEIEDVYGEHPRRCNIHQQQRQIRTREAEDIYGFPGYGLVEPAEDNRYYNPNRRGSSTPIYACSRHQPSRAVPRRVSYSYGDTGVSYNCIVSAQHRNSFMNRAVVRSDYYNCYQPLYAKLEDRRVQSPTRRSQLYESVRNNKFKPDNFGLSRYGHLQIDYSYSWNNLDKYIYN